MHSLLAEDYHLASLPQYSKHLLMRRFKDFGVKLVQEVVNELPEDEDEDEEWVLPTRSGSAPGFGGREVNPSGGGNRAVSRSLDRPDGWPEYTLGSEGRSEAWPEERPEPQPQDMPPQATPQIITQAPLFADWRNLPVFDDTSEEERQQNSPQSQTQIYGPPPPSPPPEMDTFPAPTAQAEPEVFAFPPGYEHYSGLRSTVFLHEQQQQQAGNTPQAQTQTQSQQPEDKFLRALFSPEM